MTWRFSADLGNDAVAMDQGDPEVMEVIFEHSADLSTFGRAASVDLYASSEAEHVLGSCWGCVCCFNVYNNTNSV